MTASTASRFRAAVDRAMTLDPAEIFRAIQHDAVDSGLRAATYEARVQGTTTETVTERTAERHIDHPPDTGRHVTDMIALRGAGDAWLDVVAELNAVCAGRGQSWDNSERFACADWDDACRDAHLLAEPRHPALEDDGDHDPADCDCESLIDIAARSDATCDDVAQATDRAERAIAEVQRVHDTYLGHPPRPIDTSRTNIYCRNHLQLGIERKRSTSMLCLWCWRQLKSLSVIDDPVELQLLPDYWPSEDMMRAHEEGRARDVTRYRRDWLASHGIDTSVRRGA